MQKLFLTSFSSSSSATVLLPLSPRPPATTFGGSMNKYERQLGGALWGWLAPTYVRAPVSGNKNKMWPWAGPSLDCFPQRMHPRSLAHPWRTLGPCSNPNGLARKPDSKQHESSSRFVTWPSCHFHYHLVCISCGLVEPPYCRSPPEACTRRVREMLGFGGSLGRLSQATRTRNKSNTSPFPSFCFVLKRTLIMYVMHACAPERKPG